MATQQKALVYIENKFLGAAARRALITKRLGFKNFLIYVPFNDRTVTAMEAFEREHLEPGEKVFDHVLNTEKFDLETLRSLCAELEQIAPIQAVIGMIGMFTPDGLLGGNIATLNEDRGLPSQGTDSLYRCNNKYLMRDALRAAGVPNIDFGLAVDEESAKEHAKRIGYPVIMKPLTGIASHLILKCHNEEELVDRFRLAMERLPKSFYDVYAFSHSYPDKAGVMHHFDPMTSMLIEKYLDGPEVTVECVSTEQEVVPLLVHDKVKVTEGARVFHEHMMVVPPVRFTDEEVQEMKDCVVSAIKAVGLKNSLSHVELRYDKELGPQILEINPRLGGLCIQDSLKAMIDFDASDAQLQLALGTFELRESYPSKQELHAMFTIYPEHAGLFKSVSGMEELKHLPGIVYAQQTLKPGVVINGDDEEVFLLMVWMKGESYEHIMETYERACELVTFDIEPVEQTEPVSR